VETSPGPGDKDQGRQDSTCHDVSVGFSVRQHVLLSCRDKQTLVNILMCLHPTLVTSHPSPRRAYARQHYATSRNRLDLRRLIHRPGTAVISPGSINNLSGTPDERDLSRRVRIVK